MASQCGRRIRNRFSQIHGSTKELWKRLGWTPIELANHLQNNFYNDMSWDNFGDWEIDHTIPLDSVVRENNTGKYTLVKEMPISYELWRLSNLKPLFKEDHKMKTEFSDFLRNRSKKVTAKDYVLLSNQLYDYYGENHDDRQKRKRYHYWRWPRKWIWEINQKIELNPHTYFTSWGNFHGARNNPVMCNEVLQNNLICSYKAMKTSKKCYIHSNTEINLSNNDDFSILENMMIHVPSLPKYFWKNSPIIKSQCPNKEWKNWIEEFPSNHIMLELSEIKNTLISKNAVTKMLIQNCTPGLEILTRFLKVKGYSEDEFKSKYDCFWKAHEIIVNTFVESLN